MIDFNAIKLSQGINESHLMKAHAILMIISWILLASFGILNARFYKAEWPNQTPFGLQMWFVNHRTSMLVMLTSCVVAFILIFIEAGGWTQLPSSTSSIVKAHPYVGVIVTALAILNPIMALFRPGKFAPNRPVFNWCHRIVGQSAFILAVFNIFLGFFMPQVEAVVPSWLKWVMTGYAVFHVLTEIVLALLSSAISNRKKHEFPASATELSLQATDEDPPQSPQSWILLVYVIVTLALVLTMVIVIAQA